MSGNGDGGNAAEMGTGNGNSLRACRRKQFPNQESTTYRQSISCKLLIFRSRKSISDRLSGCP